MPLASVSVAALKRDTNARTVRSNLVVDTPFPGLARSNAWKRAKLGPRGTYRYVTPPVKGSSLSLGIRPPRKLAEAKQNT